MFLLQFVSSLLMVYFSMPNRYLHLGFLSWIAFVPLFALVYQWRLNSGDWVRLWFVLWLFFGLLFVLMFWINPFGRPEWLEQPAVMLLSVFVFLLFPAIFALAVWLGSISMNSFLIALVWALIELSTLYVTGLIPLHFGLSLFDEPWFLLIARRFGAVGVSFVLILSNAVIAKICIKEMPKAGRTVWIALIISLIGIYGILGQVVIQTNHNCLQNIKDTPDEISLAIIQPASQFYLHDAENIRSLLARCPKVDLVILPEIVVNDCLIQKSEAWKQLVRGSGANKILLGSAYYDYAAKRFNNAALMTVNGQVAGIYAKNKLIPFLETDQYSGSRQSAPLWAGEKIGWVGVQICLESLYPQVSHKLKQEGAGILVLLADDAWFSESNWAYLHAAYLPFRAVENNLYAVECNNSGPSMVVDNNGRILLETKALEAGISFVKVPKVI